MQSHMWGPIRAPICVLFVSANNLLLAVGDGCCQRRSATMLAVSRSQQHNGKQRQRGRHRGRDAAKRDRRKERESHR